MCPKNIPVRPGLSWRGLTIGKSTLNDLNELYGVIATRVDPDYKGAFADIYGIALTGTASIKRKLSGAVEACVVNWKIAALAISTVSDAELSDFVPDWITRFGIPDIVRWSVGGSWRYRDLVWPQQGLGLHVDLGDASLKLAYVTLVVFFPPLQAEIEMAQWPYAQMQNTRPDLPDDGFPQEQNPFDFPSMLATSNANQTATAIMAASPAATLSPRSTPARVH